MIIHMTEQQLLERGFVVFNDCNYYYRPDTVDIYVALDGTAWLDHNYNEIVFYNINTIEDVDFLIRTLNHIK